MTVRSIAMVWSRSVGSPNRRWAIASTVARPIATRGGSGRPPNQPTARSTSATASATCPSTASSWASTSCRSTLASSVAELRATACRAASIAAANPTPNRSWRMVRAQARLCQTIGRASAGQPSWITTRFDSSARSTSSADPSSEASVLIAELNP